MDFSKDYTEHAEAFSLMDSEGEEVVLFQSKNRGGFLIEVVAELRAVGNVRYYLRTYHEQDEPDNMARYDPSLTDFRKLGILLLGLSELAKGNIYAKESSADLWRDTLKALIETLAVEAFETKDFLGRKKTAKELKHKLGWVKG